METRQRAIEKVAEPSKGDLRDENEEMQTKEQKKKERRTLGVILLMLLLDLLAFTSILPLFPAILDYYSIHSKNDPLYIAFDSAIQWFRKAIGAPDLARFNSVLFGGLLGSLFSFLQFLFSPLFGALSDISGRKTMLLVSVTGSLCSYLLWSQSSTFSLFVLSRIIGGASKGSVSIATAAVSDLLPVSRRGKGMAVVGVSFSLGFLLGPSIGAWFARSARLAADSTDHYYFSTPAYFAATITVLELFCIFFLLPETLEPSRRKTKLADVTKQALDYINPRSLVRFKPLTGRISNQDQKSLQSYGSIYLLYLFLYSGLEFTLTFFTHLKFRYDSMQQGRMYFIAGCVMILVQGGFVRRIPAANQRKAAVWGIGFIIPAYVIIGLSTTHLLFYPGLTLFSLASGIVVPCLTTCVAGFGSDSEKGTILGVFRSLGALARAAGPFAASALFWWLGPTPCYVIGGLSLILPLHLLSKMPNHHI